jgi:hypothetical protein
MTSTMEQGSPASGRGRRLGARQTPNLPPPPGNPVGVRPGGSSSRQRQLPWVALGLLLLTMSILGFALWSIQQGSRSPVLVAAVNIDAGDTIERAQLKLVSIGTDAGLSTLAAGQEDLVVGRVSRGPIPTGTPLSRALVVSASEAVPTGSAVIGALLVPGEYPTPALQTGDEVAIVGTSAAGVTGGVAEDLGRARVWAIEPVENSSQQNLFVSLLLDAPKAAEVANVEAEGRLRLVLVSNGS